MKKLVSMLLVLAMLVTVFAGLAITASAADAVQRTRSILR